MKTPDWLKDAKPWQLATAGVVFVLLARRLLMGEGGLSWSGPAEGYAPLESEEGCDLRIQPGVASFRKFVMANYGGYDAGILRECGTGGASGHKIGRSWDWGINASTDVQGMLRFLQANDNEVIRRAGLTYFIYNRKIWNTRARDWQKYTGADDHTSHVHFSFGTPGAAGRTSFYQGNAA